MKIFCKRCNTETERTKSRNCKPCSVIYRKAYQAANTDKLKAISLAYAAANREKARTRSKAWAADNPERHKANSRTYRENNKDKVKEDRRAWIAKNPDKSKEYDAKWRKTNPERAVASRKAWICANIDSVRKYGRIHSANRRAYNRANGGKLSKGLAAKLFILQRGLCPCCKQPLGNEFHLDHIIPIKLGGSNTDDNIQLLRKTCNLHKSAAHPIDFMQSKGFLL